jgi:hypothetical protein
MKKTTKKNPSKAKKKAVRNLEVKPAKGGRVRGGAEEKHDKWIVIESVSWNKR